MDIDRYLSKIYYNPASPASFSGAHKIWSYVKLRKDRPTRLTYKKIVSWLDQQDTHTIHRIPRKIFPREKIIVEGIDEQWDADLLSVADLATYNDGYTQLFVAIDLFSRYLWVRPLKNKSAKSTAAALKDIFATGRKCTTLRVDRGAEFTGKFITRLLAEENVHCIQAYNEFKASYAERANRLIQDKLYKYFYENQTFKYIDILQDVVQSYNSTPHGTTGVAPKDVNQANEYSLYEKIYIPILDKRARESVKYAFEVGQAVRVSFQRKPFQRGYKEHYSEEIFKVNARVPSHPPRYKLVDLRGEEILGSFYKEELIPVSYSESDDFKVEKIVGYKTVGRKRYAIIRWYGYSPNFDSLVPAQEVKKYSSQKGH